MEPQEKKHDFDHCGFENGKQLGEYTPDKHPLGLREGLKQHYAVKVPLHALSNKDFSNLMFSIRSEGFKYLAKGIMHDDITDINLTADNVIMAAYHRIDFLTQAVKFLLDKLEQPVPVTVSPMAATFDRLVESSLLHGGVNTGNNEGWLDAAYKDRQPEAQLDLDSGFNSLMDHFVKGDKEHSNLSEPLQAAETNDVATEAPEGWQVPKDSQ